MAVLFLLCRAAVFTSEMDECSCNPGESMRARRCSLCIVAEKQPPEAAYFFLKDASPMKPNRLLLLARSHDYDGRLPLSKMPVKLRLELWHTAIQRAQELWGDDWGVAVNGDEVRTQCHAHIHIGRLLKGVEYGKPLTVKGPEQFPVPADGSGFWVHKHGGRMHVHTGEQRAETVLLR